MNEDRTLYVTAAITPAELDEAREKTGALVVFPGEMTGLASILDGIAAEHPDAAENLAKVAQAIRVGSGFVTDCTTRLGVIFRNAQVNDPQGRPQ